MTTSQGGVRPALLVGLGSPDRGDDAVGPIVAQRIATLRLPGVQVLEQEDPTSLIDLWDDRDLAIVVDAFCSNEVPGTLTIMEPGVGGAPLVDDAWTGTGRGGTHAFGLAAAVELSRALHRLPRRLVLIGIEAGGLEHGAPLSAPVSDAVERAVRTARRILSETGALPSRRNRETGSGPALVVQEVDR
jgi:hydrogenase maturation protease